MNDLLTVRDVPSILAQFNKQLKRARVNYDALEDVPLQTELYFGTGDFVDVWEMLLEDGVEPEGVSTEPSNVGKLLVLSRGRGTFFTQDRPEDRLRALYMWQGRTIVLTETGPFWALGIPKNGSIHLPFWILENPDLVEKQSIDTRTKAEKRQRNKSRPDKPRLVTVVDLRASHKKAAADVEAAERTYRHRWIVRGHWHRYRVGKGRTEERLNYVMPYVKGPAGAPLNATERVFQW